MTALEKNREITVLQTNTPQLAKIKPWKKNEQKEQKEQVQEEEGKIRVLLKRDALCSRVWRILSLNELISSSSSYQISLRHEQAEEEGEIFFNHFSFPLVSSFHFLF